MSYVCLEAEECRVFIKNGKLRFQARKRDDQGEIKEQVTVSFPLEMAYCFTQVENMDLKQNGLSPSQNLRLKDYFSDN